MNERLLSGLKQKNLRLTNARKAIFSTLIESDVALSPKEVFEDILRQNNHIKTDQVSVYRNLTLFTEIGLAHRLNDGRYAACKHSHCSNEPHSHMHILANCSGCGKTYEVQEHTEELCNLANSMKPYLKQFSNFNGLTFQGICSSCS